MTKLTHFTQLPQINANTVLIHLISNRETGNIAISLVQNNQTSLVKGQHRQSMKGPLPNSSPLINLGLLRPIVGAKVSIAEVSDPRNDVKLTVDLSIVGGRYHTDIGECVCY